MEKLTTFLNKANKYKGDLKLCYEMGYLAGLNGANVNNCHFGLFATKEKSDTWSKGKKDGDKAKELTNKTEIGKILFNSIKCKHCKQIINSRHVHDYRPCKCGKVAVDGGLDYLKRTGYMKDYIEASILIDEKGEIINHALK